MKLLIDHPAADPEELEQLRDALGRFLDREVLPHLDAWEAEGYVPREVWRNAGEAGFLMASAPAEYGGGGANFAYDAVIVDELSRRGAHSFLLTIQNTIFAPYLIELGSEEQKRRWIPKIASGEIIAAISMTEPDSGSDLRNMKTNAKRDGDSYVINGQKIFTTLGHQADLLMVACKTSDDPKSGISLFYVETDTPGFARGRKLDKIGLNMEATAELFFDNVRVPAENLIGGEEGLGMTQLTTNLAQERLVVAIQSAAMMARAIEETVDYVKQRKAFRQTVFDFQNTQFTLAECKTETTIANTFVSDCIRRHLSHELDSVTAAMAKMWVSEAQGRVVDRCLQLFGGYGYMNEYPIARMYRDTRAARIYGGTNEIMRLIIGKSL
jgi:acyl-CoA dehydrogenase